MMAAVFLKMAYDVIEETLKLGPVSAETNSALKAVLSRAPGTKVIFANAFLGEYESLAASMESGMGDAKKVEAFANAPSWSTWFSVTVVCSATLTKKDLLSYMREACAFCQQRQIAELKPLSEEKTPFWQIKNTVGERVLALAKADYTKFAERIWSGEDQRLALIARLEGKVPESAK
jgi:hypothetical protein